MCKGLILPIISFLLLGCTTVSYLPSLSQTFKPTQSIEILNNTPDKPYITLGKIIAEGQGISYQTLYIKLKQKAMRIGADAVLIEKTTSNLGSMDFNLRKIEGLAIKWES